MATPDLVGIIVQDMGRALAFYRLLGLEIPTEADAEAHVEYKTPGGFRLAWDTAALMESIHGAWHPPTGHRMGMAFLCANAAEVDEIYNNVTAAGYEGQKPPWDAFWGQRYAIVVDPDGNLIDLFAPL
ncbi:MAG: VOC family protein [Anaerolineales bacterium]|nr:VOC family protein [Anaerolineales bacterium]MCB9435174.1 VOC family protein [Ardenticatenaceae bacterium]